VWTLSSCTLDDVALVLVLERGADVALTWTPYDVALI
jgi:hypothetical protein